MAERFRVSYRREFEAVIEAASPEEALEKFQSGECQYRLCCPGKVSLWEEYMEVEPADQE